MRRSCGCTNTTTFLLVHHKTGNMLSSAIARSVNKECPHVGFHAIFESVLQYEDGPRVDTETKVDRQGYPTKSHEPLDSLGDRCRVAYGTAEFLCALAGKLDPSNMFVNDGVTACIRQLSAPGEGRRYIHIIREPYSLVTSTYQYHRQGEEGTNYWFSSFNKELASMSFQKGVIHTAEHVLRFQLPVMVRMHARLQRQPWALTLRLDTLLQSSQDFDRAVSDFVQHLGVDWRMHSSLMRGIQRLDVNRMRTVTGGGGSARVAIHHIHSLDLAGKRPSWHNSSRIRAVLRGNAAISSELEKFGALMGYKY
jgi:hypothetical protein